MTLAGRKGISASFWEDCCQLRIVSMSCSLTEKSSQLRTALSRRTRMEYGREADKIGDWVSKLLMETYRYEDLRAREACRSCVWNHHVPEMSWYSCRRGLAEEKTRKLWLQGPPCAGGSIAWSFRCSRFFTFVLSTDLVCSFWLNLILSTPTSLFQIRIHISLIF